MTDQMDVDITPSSSGAISVSSSSSEKLDLTGLDLDALNDRMYTSCDEGYWRGRIERNKDWPNLIPEVLISLLEVLEATDMRDKFISKSGAMRMAYHLKDDGLEEWKAGVRDGVEKNDWTALILHPKLRNRKVLKEALRVPIAYKEAVIRAWNFKYLGSAHKVLLKAIDEVHNLPIQRNYAKNVPIAQSSGTGKSKTVDKVATERILFPICLREDIGKDHFAYPLTDKAVRDHFGLAPGTADEAGCKEYIRSFLASLFKSARRQAEQLFPLDKEVSYADMAKAFYNFFADSSKRDGFYGKVVADSRKGTHKDVWKSFKDLKETLQGRCSQWPPSKVCPLLISIDEVHVLYTRRSIDLGSEYTLYSRLKSVLNEGATYDFAIVSLSTTVSHVSSLATSRETAPSMREREDGRILPAPFTELPFDIYVADDPLAPGKATLTSVGSLEFTAKFGRPLFHASYLSHKSRNTPNLVEGIMRTVREKLSGRTWPPEAPADLDTPSIAVLSARLLLDLSPATANANRYEQELVRNHLRILYSVHGDRQTIVTGSSPEPLIAEASAQIMHYTLEGNTPYIDYWDLLGKFVDHGLAAQGTIGELIGRALSISAMDRAINGLTDICELKYQTPVTVTDYYKALLTKEAWEVLRKSTPANGARLSNNSATKTFEVAFQDAYFHFSHYGKANDSSPMRATYAWALWLRGTAVACQLDQALTDRMAPIYFSSLGNVSPTTISVNLDQDNTAQSMNPVHAATQSAEDISIFPHGIKLPYIAAVHCYSLTENQGIAVTKPSPYHLRNHINDEEAPRYQVDFHGLSAYGNITDTVRNAIRTMINRSKNAVFNHHRRDYGVPSLRQMLPVLTEDPASTEWFGGFDQANTRNM